MPLAEKGYQKNAWMILFALGALFFVLGIDASLIGLGVLTPDAFAPVKIITGMSWSEIQILSPGPATFITDAISAAGGAGIASGLFGMYISVRPFRRGEKGAWYVMLYLPLYSAGVLAGVFSGGKFIFAPVLVWSLIGLFLPYRKFFPRKSSI